MKLISLKIKGFKNLDLDLDFTQSDGISVFVGNNGSGKSNVLEAISAIFYGLYNKIDFDPDFEFELQYEIKKSSLLLSAANELLLISENGEGLIVSEDIILFGVKHIEQFLSFYINGKNLSLSHTQIDEYLPSQVIALYSGEETRLYQEYYVDEYNNFVESIVYGEKVLQDRINMNFIDKSFWNIALLTFAIYGDNFSYEDILGIPSLKEVQFDFNGETLGVFSDKIEADFLNFLKYLKDKKGFIALQELKEVNTIGVYKDFYKMLLVAMLTRKDKYRILDFIIIYFDNDNGEFDAENLSEGQKKQILLYFVTTILADKDSIILLDEPDSYIHVGNKQKIQDFCSKYLKREGGGEIIMTTHSPTLMHKFDKKHLFYLENGKLDLKEKREILDKITDGQMSLNEMEVFLNSGNKYLLVTEGITDKKHLEIAIEKLGIKNNYDIYSADGADKLKQFLVGLPKGFFTNKVVIGIFDYDTEGLNNLKIGDQIEENKKYKVKDRENIFGITLPYYDDKFANYKNFTIEFMYSEEILKQYNMLEKRKLNDVNCGVKSQDLILSTREFPNENHLCFFKISEASISKNSFTDIVRELESSEFENFRVLFDLIQSIE